MKLKKYFAATVSMGPNTL